MLKFYIFHKNSLESVNIEEIEQNISELVWIDLFYPTHEEDLFVENLLGIGIPTREDMSEIELSSRLYKENGSIYATATILTNADTNEPASNAITFVLTKQCLITVRYSDPTPFKLFPQRFSSNEETCDSSIIITSLMETIVDRIADILENAGRSIDAVTKKIFRPQLVGKNERKKEKPDFEEILRQVGIIGDLTSKIEESMVNINRLVSFISTTSYFKPNSEESERLNTILKDIQSLSEHSSFLANKVNFLLDAALGMISIEQNAIIKIVSVAAVVFLPPTLVASIYGMNFHIMPELNWSFGYPFAIVLMTISAILPYKFFRRKGWL